MDFKFQLLNKPVKNKRQKLGRVEDYSFDEDDLFIHKLYVGKSMVKVFSNNDTLVIDRNQIVEITDNYILVDDAEVKVSEAEQAEEPAATEPVPAA